MIRKKQFFAKKNCSPEMANERLKILVANFGTAQKQAQYLLIVDPLWGMIPPEVSRKLTRIDATNTSGS